MNEQHIAASGNDGLDELNNVLLLFLQDAVHRSVVVDNDIALKVSLRGRKAELNETDLGTLLPSGSTSESGDLLLSEDEAVDNL